LLGSPVHAGPARSPGAGTDCCVGGPSAAVVPPGRSDLPAPRPAGALRKPPPGARLRLRPR